MKTEDLIADLATRATPVRPLASPAIRFAGWFAIAAACALAGLAAFGPRADLAEAIARPAFMATAALTLGVAVVSGFAALVLAIPGAERSPALRMTALTLLGAWGVELVTGLIREGGGFPSDAHWPVCIIRIIVVGMIPAWALAGMLRRAAPLRLAPTGAMAAIAAMAAAAVAIQFACPFDAPSHLIRGHFAPVVVFAALGAWLAPRFLNRA
jgi:hypothetical protein